MQVITSYVCPPIPDRSADWEACLDCHDGDEDAPRGRGETKLAALFDLFDQIEDEAQMTVVWERINELERQW
jgi:hypothetical protein